MSDLIRRDDDPPAPVAISKTELRPIRSTDSPSGWRKFWDIARGLIGLKPLDMALRYGEAETRKKEAEADGLDIDNEVKLLKARQEFDLTQAEIRRLDAETQNKREEAATENERKKAEARSAKADARIKEAAARAIERRGQTVEQAEAEVRRLVDKIRSLGGDVEIPPMIAEHEVTGERRADEPSMQQLEWEFQKSFQVAVLKLYPGAVARQLADAPGEPWVIVTELGSHVGTGLSETDAWADAAKHLPQPPRG